MRVLIAAGGTGGHILPAITIANKLIQMPDIEIRFVGIGKQLERDLIETAGYPLSSVPFVPVLGGGIKGIFRLAFSFPKAFFATRKLFKEFKPDIVVGFGGYPSFMPIILAWLMRIPTILHEPNAEVGLANKVLSLFAKKILAVKGAKGFWRKSRVENIAVPVRDEFYQIKPWQMPESGRDGSGRFSILVLGGSQGSVSINNAILKACRHFRNLNISLVHQTGKQDYSRVVGEYHKQGYAPEKVVAYIENVCAEYENAQLIICRAGALTVSEIMAAKRPAIFIPLAIAAGHQRHNVGHLEKAEACLVQDEQPGWQENLTDQIKSLASDPQKLEKIVSNLTAFTIKQKESSTVFVEEINRMVGASI